MDEITDQFRTEDAEEFKQIQAELEVAGRRSDLTACMTFGSPLLPAKNCRILQFKLRKAEKRNENVEVEKASLEGKDRRRRFSLTLDRIGIERRATLLCL